MVQNTATIPAAAPTAPKSSGRTVLLALRTTVRPPTASAPRPPGPPAQTRPIPSPSQPPPAQRLSGAALPDAGVGEAGRALGGPPERTAGEGGQHPVGAAMPERADRESGYGWPNEVGGGEAQREPAEVVAAALGRAHFAHHVLRADVYQRERRPRQRGRDRHHREAGKQPRERHGEREKRRADEERPAHADPVDETPRGDAEEHRQRCDERHQHADHERRGAERERVQREGEAAAVVGGVGENERYGEAPTPP